MMISMGIYWQYRKQIAKKRDVRNRNISRNDHNTETRLLSSCIIMMEPAYGGVMRMTGSFDDEFSQVRVPGREELPH